MKLRKITDTYAFMPQAVLEVRIEDESTMIQLRDMSLDKRMVVLYSTTEGAIEQLDYAIKVLQKVRTQAKKLAKGKQNDSGD